MHIYIYIFRISRIKHRQPCIFWSINHPRPSPHGPFGRAWPGIRSIPSGLCESLWPGAGPCCSMVRFGWLDTGCGPSNKVLEPFTLIENLSNSIRFYEFISCSFHVYPIWSIHSSLWPTFWGIPRHPFLSDPGLAQVASASCFQQWLLCCQTEAIHLQEIWRFVWFTRGIPSGNQAWLAGIWTINLCNFPI